MVLSSPGRSRRRGQRGLLLALISTGLGCATHSNLAVQPCVPGERLHRGMSRDEVREAFGSPAVAGIARATYRDPLRLAIGSPADTPGVTWLYPNDGADQNAWFVLTFHGDEVGDIRCAHAWFEMEHDPAEQLDVAGEVWSP